MYLQLTKRGLDIRTCDQEKSASDWKRMRDRTTAKVYVFPEGESILQSLRNRFSRPQQAYREAVGPSLEKALRERGFLPEGTPFKMAWSQKAGCACGCSPGFIVKGTTTGVDVYCHVEDVK